jgi:hypothetical protein
MKKSRFKAMKAVYTTSANLDGVQTGAPLGETDNRFETDPGKQTQVA